MSLFAYIFDMRFKIFSFILSSSKSCPSQNLLSNLLLKIFSSSKSSPRSSLLLPKSLHPKNRLLGKMFIWLVERKVCKCVNKTQSYKMAFIWVKNSVFFIKPFRYYWNIMSKRVDHKISIYIWGICVFQYTKIEVFH